MKIKLIVTLTLLAFAAGCDNEQPTLENLGQYLAWLNDPGSGMSREKVTRDLRLRMTYLPPEYLAWREMTRCDDRSVGTRDSLLAMYRHSRAFLLSITPNAELAHGDIMYKDIGDYNQYAARMKTMNFSMNEYLTLACGGSQYAPSLALLENIYGLRDGRRVLLLFTPRKDQAPLAEQGTLDITFYDEIFQTGIHRFAFDQRAATRAPALPAPAGPR